MRNSDPFDLVKQITGRTHPIVTRYLHGSVILDRNGRIISWGQNHFAGRVIRIDDGGLVSKTVHSEVHALSKVNIRGLSGATIINYGKTNVRSILSKPCANCNVIIRQLGFKKLFYSLESPLNSPVWKEVYL